LKPEVVL